MAVLLASPLAAKDKKAEKWDGETLTQQLGFGGDGEQAMRRVQGMLAAALKKLPAPD
jgi:uncharacterized membrane-anchored protein